MATPKATRPYMPGYGLLPENDGTGLLPWSWAETRLMNSRNYWLATVWPQRRPHVMPVWGMWQEGLATWFSGQLNPALPVSRLFWLPADLVPRAEAQRAAIAAALLANIDATGDAYDRFFTRIDEPVLGDLRGVISGS